MTQDGCLLHAESILGHFQVTVGTLESIHPQHGAEKRLHIGDTEETLLLLSADRPQTLHLIPPGTVTHKRCHLVNLKIALSPRQRYKDWLADWLTDIQPKQRSMMADRCSKWWLLNRDIYKTAFTNTTGRHCFLEGGRTEWLWKIITHLQQRSSLMHTQTHTCMQTWLVKKSSPFWEFYVV